MSWLLHLLRLDAFGRLRPEHEDRLNIRRRRGVPLHLRRLVLTVVYWGIYLLPLVFSRLLTHYPTDLRDIQS